MNQTVARRALQIAFIAALAACSRKQQPPVPVRVLITPDVAAVGIAGHLGDVFAAQSGRKLDIRVVPSAAMLAEVGRGAADVVVTNDAAIVDALRTAQKIRLTSTFASDDYEILGPHHDRAHVRSAATAEAAFHRIYARRVPFCSPVSVPPLHDRELAIWRKAGVVPGKNRHYAERAGDAAAVLAEASKRGAYTLTDRATADAVRPEHLRVLLRGVPMLANDFTIILLQQPNVTKDATWFVEWVMSFRGRDAIDSYRVNGQRRLYLER